MLFVYWPFSPLKTRMHLEARYWVALSDLVNFTLSFSASSTMLGAPVFNEYLLNNRNLVFYVRSPQKLPPKQGFTSKLLTWAIILEVLVGGGKGEREDWRTAGTVSISELFTPEGNWGSILLVLFVGHS